jgi:DNA (cytosine-5)-methyltransferase 1
MNALSLFSGGGGIDIAGEWAGIQTVAFCEREPYAQKLLNQEYPGIPVYDDVCTLTKARLENDGIDTRTIRIIHGGFPCQPFSIAGEQLGTEDNRHLWPEMFRIINEIRPDWVIGENVANFVRVALDDALSDLESIGYTTRAFIIPASAIGADNRRDRVFIVANAMREGLEGLHDESIGKQMQLPEITFPRDNRSPTPRILRRGDGVSNGSDRIKILGNAVNPYQVYPILAAIKQIDEKIKELST